METRRCGGQLAGTGASDTKYRDIADGNFQLLRWSASRTEVRYQVPRYSGWKLLEVLAAVNTSAPLETKYCDIADGNLR